MFFGAGAVVLLIPDIMTAFSFLGGTCAVIIVITFPGMLHLKLSKKRWFQGWNLLITIIITFYSLAGWAAAIISTAATIGWIKLPDV